MGRWVRPLVFGRGNDAKEELWGQYGDKKMIQVEIEGYDQPVEFEDGTDPEVIQRKVKELVTGIDPRTGQKIGTITKETFTRSLIGVVKEEGPAVVGGIATGVAAAMAGPVTLPAMAGYVTLGAAGGESIRQIGQHLSGSLGAPKTSIESAKKIATKGIEEGVWEAFGGLAMKGVRKILAPFGKSVTKEAKEVTDVFKDKLRPIVLLPAEATESRTLDLLQNVAEASLIGGNRIADFKTNRTKFYNNLADSVIDQFGERTDPSDLGNLFVSAIEAKRATHAKVSQILYNNVQNAIDMGGGKSLTAKGTRIYHGRVGRLSESSRIGDIGVHFTEDLETAKGLGTGEHLVHDFGARKAGPSPEGVVHSTDIDPSEFIELPDMVDWNMQEVVSELGKKGVDVGNDLWGSLKKAGYKGIKYANEFEGEGVMSYILNPKEALESVPRKAAGLTPESFGGTPAGVQVSTDSLKSFIAPMRRIAADLGSIEAKNAGDDLIGAIEDLPDTLTFDSARELRSRLISKVDEFSVLNKKAPAIGKARKMIGLIDGAIEKSLSENPEAYDAWRIANRFYKEGQKKFNNTMIRRLIKMAEDTGTGAEMIAPVIFRPGQVSKVRKAKMAMDPPTWRKMKGFFVQHLMQKATDVDGVIKGKRLTNLISGKPNSFGLPMMKEVLTESQVKGLQDMAKALELSQARQAEGAGKVLIQLSQAGAVGVMASGTLELPAATIIFGPALLSRMMLSPPVAKWLTKGITMPANSEVAAGILTRLMAAANRIRNNMEKERETENEK